VAQEFEITQLRKNIYQFQNCVGNCATLVLGRKRALLFDTMAGFGDLKGNIAQITALPLVVVNSHGHFDHIGGNYQFDFIYLSQLDWPLLDVYGTALEEIQSNMGQDLSASQQSYHMTERICDIKPGTVLDLGDITAEVVSLPGHTPGSIGLLLREDKILLAGDAVSPEMCLFFPESLPVEEYIHTLQAIMQMDIDFFVQGHFARLFPKAFLQKFLECARLPGCRKGFEYINSLIPSLKGLLYILEFQNKETGGIICIITKEQGNVPDRLGRP